MSHAKSRSFASDKRSPSPRLLLTSVLGVSLAAAVYACGG
ncbi:hypothetical protein BH11MYX4_BH11MYX4_02150 [soil metagenome]